MVELETQDVRGHVRRGYLRAKAKAASVAYSYAAELRFMAADAIATGKDHAKAEELRQRSITAEQIAQEILRIEWRGFQKEGYFR